jgi:23S rRNA (uracil747-C5)-methyltransferase
MGQPYRSQVADKAAAVRAALGPQVHWLDPVTGPEQGYRNRAKVVVAGTVAEPTLGILDGEGHGVDLAGCGLYPAAITAAIEVLRDFLVRAALQPYDVPTRTGELKYLLITCSPDEELMVRFVLRSTEAVARIRKHLPGLITRLPALAVASVNIQPAPAAVLEGEREIALTAATELVMRLGDVSLLLPARSFFQTNSVVAAALYRQVAGWVEELAPASVWDLYAGVGGFALHCAAPGRRVVAVETSAAAVAAGRSAALRSGLTGVELVAGDATAFALAAPAPPELVVVNPPRRGLGAELAGWLEASGVRHVVYSSCNVTSMAEDLAAMPSLRPRTARLLDMFPQTAHHEVVALLERVGA